MTSNKEYQKVEHPNRRTSHKPQVKYKRQHVVAASLSSKWRLKTRIVLSSSSSSSSSSLLSLLLVATVIKTTNTLAIDAFGAGPLRPVDLKVASMASKLEHWFTCHRFQQTGLQSTSATATPSASSSQQPNVIPTSINHSDLEERNININSNNNLETGTNKSSLSLASCAAHFDGHLCWPPTLAGQTIELPCPKLYWLPKLMATTTSGKLIDVPLIEAGATLANLMLSSTSTPNSSSVINSSSTTKPTSPTTLNNQLPVNEGQPTRQPEVGESRLIMSRASGASAASTSSPDKFAYRKCLAEVANQPEVAAAPALAAWQIEADYSNCRSQLSGDESAAPSIDPTDKWIKLDTDESDKRLFQILVEELDRIEVTIDPYSDPDLLEQWTMCIGEIMQSFSSIPGVDSSSRTSSIAGAGAGSPIEGGQGEANEQRAGRDKGTSQSPANLTCPIIFDGWRCWPATKAGQTAYVSCPSNQPGFSAERKAHKICTEDGTWYKHPMTNRYWSNYTTCVDTDDLGFRRRIINLYVIGNLISLVALTASLIIFISFKSLNCTRVTIHKNLFLSFITNNLMWVIWYTFVVNNPDLLNSNPIECRLWHILLHYFLVSNYFWMFCEGLYLHTLLVVAFVSEDKILKWFYLLGWLTPIPVTIAYAYRRSSDQYYTNYCWMEESPHNLILMAPIGISLLLNLIFLINIVRVLVTKLRANNSPDTHQTRKAVRATLFLVPLLGLHYMLTPFRPEAKSEWEMIYEIIAAVCTSFQGLCVALLFCFCNGEVIAVISKNFKDTFGLTPKQLGRNGISSHHQNQNQNNPNNNNSTYYQDNCHYDDYQNDRRLSLANQMRNRSNTLTTNVTGSELLQARQSIACNDFGKSHCLQSSTGRGRAAAAVAAAAAATANATKTMILAGDSSNPTAMIPMMANGNSSGSIISNNTTTITSATDYFASGHRTSVPQTAPVLSTATNPISQFNGTANSSNSNCSSLMTTVTVSPVLQVASSASGNGDIFAAVDASPSKVSANLETSAKLNGINVTTNLVRPLDLCRNFELDETVNLLADHHHQQQQQQATMIATTSADGKTTTTATAPTTTTISIA